MNFGFITAKKYFWFLNLSVISAISYLSADLTGFLIKRQLVSHTPELSEERRSVRTVPKAKPPLDFYSVISGRNVFSDEPAGNREKEGQEESVINAAGTEKPEINEDSVPVSSLNMTLVGTSVKGGSGYIAILENRASKVQKGYRIGDELLPGVTVTDITRQSVTVLRNGKPEVLYYPEIGKAGSVKKARGKTRGKAGRRDRRVTNITETMKILDRRYVDNELKDMGRLLTQIRAVPVAKKGFKVFNIVKGSIFEKIGLKNGDMLKRINGLDMSSPDKAMQMYMQLKGATNLQLDIERNGALQSYDYTIR